MVIVHRHIHVSHVVLIVGWNQGRCRCHKNGTANVVMGLGILNRTAYGGIAKTIGRALHLHAGRLVGGGP